MKRISQTWPMAGLGLLALALLSGCGRSPVEPYETFVDLTKVYDDTPKHSSGNAYDGYVAAALMADESAGDAELRVNFTPGMKKQLVAQLEPALGELKSSTLKACEFRFSPASPDRRSKYLGGWLLLTKAVTWSISNHLDAKEYDKAVEIALAGSKFGLDLMGGDAAEAALGLEACEQIQGALGPALSEMPAATLNRLSDGLVKRLKSRPRLALCIGNEGENMLASVQFVQSAYRTKSFDAVKAITQKDGREALDYLQNLKSSERPKYFRGMAEESRQLTAQLIVASALPTVDREKIKPPEGGYRPWKRFSKHFFGAAEPLLAMNDRVIARMNLLAASSAIQAEIKTSGAAPDRVPNRLAGCAMDPYSGKPLIYRATGTEFKLYSVGANCRDDGGESGANGQNPDLLLRSK